MLFGMGGLGGGGSGRIIPAVYMFTSGAISISHSAVPQLGQFMLLSMGGLRLFLHLSRNYDTGGRVGAIIPAVYINGGVTLSLVFQ